MGRQRVLFLAQFPLESRGPGKFVQSMPVILPLSEIRGLKALLCLAQHNLNRSFWKIVIQFIREGKMPNLPKRNPDVQKGQAGETKVLFAVSYSVTLLRSTLFHFYFQIT